MLQFNSGLPLNLRSNRDLNADGVLATGPSASPATRSTCPRATTWTCATRGSFRSARGARAELIAEVKNLFNNRQTSALPRIITTDAAGVPATAIPAQRRRLPGRGPQRIRGAAVPGRVKFYF